MSAETASTEEPPEPETPDQVTVVPASDIAKDQAEPLAHVIDISAARQRQIADEKCRAVLQSAESSDFDRERAFEALTTRYSPQLLKYITSLTGSWDTADDLLQETWLSVHKHINGFDASRAALGTWIYRIAYTRAIDQIRKNRRNKEDELNMNTSLPSYSASQRLAQPHVALELQESLREIGPAMNKLRPHQRDAVLLSAGGSTIEDMARSMGKSGNAAKVILYRARKKLKATIAKQA